MRILIPPVFNNPQKKKKKKKNWQTDGCPMGREWIQFSDRLNQRVLDTVLTYCQQRLELEQKGYRGKSSSS
jgi:hypothetical protein